MEMSGSDLMERYLPYMFGLAYFFRAMQGDIPPKYGLTVYRTVPTFEDPELPIDR